MEKSEKANTYTYYAAGHTDHNIADGVELTFDEERSNKKSNRVTPRRAYVISDNRLSPPELTCYAE
jgi:hypothetical protein